MFEIICIATGVVIVAGALSAYARTGDAFHPAIICCPPFLYVYCLWPILLNRDGGLERYLSADSLEYAAIVFLLSILVMYVGMLHGARRIPKPAGPTTGIYGIELTPALSQRLFWLAVALGVVALAAYWHMIGNAGGFFSAYGRAKGGGWASSGYIGEAVLLAFPALLLLAIGIRGRGGRIRLQDIALALIIASPHLLQGTFGGRRGPLFLVLGILYFSWYLARNRMPSLKQSVAALCVIGLIVITVQSQRRHIYLGSEGDFETSRVLDKIAPSRVTAGNTYLVAAGGIQAADYFADYYWGYRYFVTFFVRPIPKQIWPTKYQDVGADWIHENFAEGTFLRFRAATGIEVQAGASGGAISDGYTEFWWGVLLMFYGLGRAFAYVWRKHRLEGGYWTILFYLMLILSVYLPTQSFSAWMHRLMFMGIPSYFIWRYWISDTSPRAAPRVA